MSGGRAGCFWRHGESECLLTICRSRTQCFEESREGGLGAKPALYSSALVVEWVVRLRKVVRRKWLFRFWAGFFLLGSCGVKPQL